MSDKNIYLKNKKEINSVEGQRTQRIGPMGGHALMTGHTEKPKNINKTLKRISKYFTNHYFELFLVFIFVLITTGSMLTGPFVIGKTIDRYIIPGNFNGLFKISLLLLFIYLIGALSAWLQNYLMASLSQDIIKEIRNDLFSKLQSLPLKFFDSKTHGELMSRITNDIDNINNGLSMSITQIISSAITIIGTLVMMIILSPILTIFSVVIIPIMIFATGFIAKRTKTFFLSNQTKLGELNGLIEETISGQKAVKVFTHEDNLIKKLSVINNELKNVGIKAQVFSGIIQPFMNVLNNLSYAIVAGAGGWLVIIKIISIGTIASFISYTKQFTRPLNEVANLFNTIQSAIAGAERVFQIMDQQPELPDKDDAIELDSIVGEVKFKNVTFGYNLDAEVLNNINISVKSGDTIALVGPTGAGKTTIVNLLMRFYDVDKGTITIDGHDIKSIKRKNLRKHIGIVLQDTHLFSDTVRENIRFGNNSSDVDVEYAAKLANANHFINKLPHKYDTILSEDGNNLSQGQRQLLSIARAVLANPSILILDEATSSVDTRTEAHIQEAMLNLMKGRTCFVIAHRLSTIRNANLILIINNGRIIEQGTHEELVNLKGLYYDLYTNMVRLQNK